jgi:hypothetical protein
LANYKDIFSPSRSNNLFSKWDLNTANGISSSSGTEEGVLSKSSVAGSVREYLAVLLKAPAVILLFTVTVFHIFIMTMTMQNYIKYFILPEIRKVFSGRHAFRVFVFILLTMLS